MTNFMMKEYNLERTPWEKACKWLFRVIYRFYRPKLGCRRIRVNQPFKYYINGKLSCGTYMYSQGNTKSLFNIGLFEQTSKGGWVRFGRDNFFCMGSGVHWDIEYLDELEQKAKVREA